MGLPLITTDTPGCRDVVEDQVNGLLTPPRDPIALSKAILQLAQRPDLRERFARAARERAVQRFDLSVVVAETRRVYQELLVRKKPKERGVPALAVSR
jgi:glycosyltransferase involved in cell wall biosynthesis